MALIFEWNKRKAASNYRKHRVSFEEAATAFGDPLSLTISDPEHSQEEERFIHIGKSAMQRLLVVVHTEQSDIIRIISARFASRGEREAYEES